MKKGYTRVTRIFRIILIISFIAPISILIWLLLTPYNSSSIIWQLGGSLLEFFGSGLSVLAAIYIVFLSFDQEKMQAIAQEEKENKLITDYFLLTLLPSIEKYCKDILDSSQKDIDSRFNINTVILPAEFESKLHNAFPMETQLDIVSMKVELKKLEELNKRMNEIIIDKNRITIHPFLDELTQESRTNEGSNSKIQNELDYAINYIIKKRKDSLEMVLNLCIKLKNNHDGQNKATNC